MLCFAHALCYARARVEPLRGLQEAEHERSKVRERLNKTEGFVKPELAATLPVKPLTGSVAASSGPVGSQIAGTEPELAATLPVLARSGNPEWRMLCFAEPRRGSAKQSMRQHLPRQR